MKIFGIGLNKTGTTTFTAALRILGYQAVHYQLPDKTRVDTLIQRAATEDKPLLHYMADVDAFSDHPIYTYYKQLDEQYPGSKFICTLRDLNSWMRSYTTHVRAVNKMAAAGHNIPAWDEPSRLELIATHTNHYADVRKYFADRPDDILYYDICGGEQWEPLCAFLNKSVPSRRFPCQLVQYPTEATQKLTPVAPPWMPWTQPADDQSSAGQ